MEQELATMDRLAAGLPTKSEKIRTLSRSGYTRSQIANFLGIRYQHVRNVLKDAECASAKRQATSATTGMSESGRTFEGHTAEVGRAAQRVTVGANGTVRLPKTVLEAAGIRKGDPLLVQFDDDEIKLYTIDSATRRVRALVRRHVPEDVSLVDELLAERRRESERESGE